MRVLIVEDDNMIAEAVCANLKDSGYAADRVKNGAQTAAAVQAQEYDLLLLDLGLPGLDGLQVLARLRSSGCQVPVLAPTTTTSATTSTAACTVWTAGRTTISSSLSTWPNCRRGCVPSCGATTAKASRS